MEASKKTMTPADKPSNMYRLNKNDYHVPITRKKVEVIFHAHKSVLYNDGEPWVKKEGGTFNVTKGAYDLAKMCELIGIHMLYLIGTKYDSKILG